MNIQFYPLSVLLLALVGFTANSSVSAETFDPSWSLEFAVEPKETSISGQKISELHGVLRLANYVMANMPRSCWFKMIVAMKCCSYYWLKVRAQGFRRCISSKGLLCGVCA